MYCGTVNAEIQLKSDVLKYARNWHSFVPHECFAVVRQTAVSRHIEDQLTAKCHHGKFIQGSRVMTFEALPPIIGTSAIS